MPYSDPEKQRTWAEAHGRGVRTEAKEKWMVSHPCACGQPATMILAADGPMPKGIWSWRLQRREALLATCLILCADCGTPVLNERRSRTQSRNARLRTPRLCGMPGCDRPHEAHGLCTGCLYRRDHPPKLKLPPKVSKVPNLEAPKVPKLAPTKVERSEPKVTSLAEPSTPPAPPPPQRYASVNDEPLVDPSPNLERRKTAKKAKPGPSDFAEEMAGNERRLLLRELREERRERLGYGQS